MEGSPSLLRFPESFPLTVIGLQSDTFIPHVKEIIGRHVGGLAETAYGNRTSGGGKYCSLTVTFTAVSREQIEQLHRDLRSSPLVLVVL